MEFLPWFSGGFTPIRPAKIKRIFQITMDFFKSFNVIFQFSFANLRIFSILQMFLKSVSRIPFINNNP